VDEWMGAKPVLSLAQFKNRCQNKQPWISEHISKKATT
jgi:hypothetical protein